MLTKVIIKIFHEAIEKHSNYHTIFNRNIDEPAGSKERRAKDGQIPDLSVLVKLDNSTTLPFACKIEDLNHMKNIPAKGCQSPDFIKPCKIMKSGLDHMCIIDSKVVLACLLKVGNKLQEHDAYTQILTLFIQASPPSNS